MLLCWMLLLDVSMLDACNLDSAFLNVAVVAKLKQFICALRRNGSGTAGP